MRLKHLKVTGLQGTNPLELTNNFVDLAKTSLSLQLSTDEFAVLMSAKMPTRSATIVFSNYWKRNMCYNRRTQLKGSNIFIIEYLNPEESKLFYECRQLRKGKIIQNTWTRNNKIYIRRSFNSALAMREITGLPIKGKTSHERYNNDQIRLFYRP